MVSDVSLRHYSMVEELKQNLTTHRTMYYDTFGDGGDDAAGDTYYQIVDTLWRKSLALHEIR